MEYAETLRWTARYLGLWLLAVAVGGALVVAGVALGGLAPLGYWSATPAALRVGGAPYGGVALMALGALAFKFGSTAALVHVVVGAAEHRLSAGLSTEALKSDILSVLDARLSEMHEEIRETRRQVARSGGNSSGGFEFED